MDRMKVGGRDVRTNHVFKLAEGRADKAMADARRNNTDDVFVKVGKDVFVASGSYIATDIKEGQEALVDGRKGLVVHVDHQGSNSRLLAGAAIGAAVGAAIGLAVRNVGFGAYLGGFLGGGLAIGRNQDNPDFMRIHAED